MTESESDPEPCQSCGRSRATSLTANEALELYDYRGGSCGVCRLTFFTREGRSAAAREIRRLRAEAD